MFEAVDLIKLEVCCKTLSDELSCRQFIDKLKIGQIFSKGLLE